MCSASEALIRFEGREIPADSGQTVLAALEAAGVKVESSCRSGVCQTCLMRCIEGAVPKKAQDGLTELQKAQGLFMPCVCLAEQPILIARADDARQRAEAAIEALDWLSPSVLRVRLRPAQPFGFRPGQFLSLIAEPGLVRSYSIASTPDQGPLVELHVRILPGGRMSGRLSSATALGDRMTLAGPSGVCCYDAVDPDQPLVLAGAGTGLAPLWGVLHDALAHGHRAPITLHHGALTAEGLYLVEPLQALERAHPGFRYLPAVRAIDPVRGDLVQAVSGAETAREALHLLCGDGALVKSMQRKLFLGGVPLKQIRADPFLAAA